MTTFLDLPPADQARVGRAVHDILGALEKDWVDQNPDENGEWTPTYRNYLHNIITRKILGAMFAAVALALVFGAAPTPASAHPDHATCHRHADGTSHCR